MSSLAPLRKADALYSEAGPHETPQEDVVGIVGDLSDDEPIDNRSIDLCSRCSCGPADARGDQRAPQRRGSLQKPAAVQG